jgi:hypothetical protein
MAANLRLLEAATSNLAELQAKDLPKIDEAYVLIKVQHPVDEPSFTFGNIVMMKHPYKPRPEIGTKLHHTAK